MKRHMKEPYTAPEAELICFRPMEHLMSQDEFQDTMDLFGGGSDVPTGSGDIEVDPWK